MLPNSVSQFQFFHNRNSWQIFCVHLNAIGLVNQALTTTWYTFNSQLYQQTNGIARTSIFNHSWNLYAGNLLQKNLQYLRCSILQKSGNDLLMAFIPFLKRTLLENFFHLINNLYGNINFTMEEESNRELCFLTLYWNGIMERSLYWYIESIHILTNAYAAALTTKQVSRKALFPPCL